MKTESNQATLQARWHRPDRVFFAKGACHVLAEVFLRRHATQGFRPVLIWPAAGFRGSHLFVTDGATVFDWHGYSAYEPFLTHALDKLRRQQAGWAGELIPVEGSPAAEAFCTQYNHRRPEEFYGDVIARADGFLDRIEGTVIS